jgi:predicted ABC-class ATPase
MGTFEQLRTCLERIEGRSYGAYRDLVGTWQTKEFEFIVDHVQGDPFAAPSRVRVRVKGTVGDADRQCLDGRVAAEDWLLRRFAQSLPNERRGSGRSGEFQCLTPGPEIEERSAVRVFPDGTVEARFRLGFPARGRRVLGRAAWSMINEDVRKAAGILCESDGLEKHIRSVRRQRALRRSLRSAGLVAFVADGAVLARTSGVDQRPLDGAVPFVSPESLRVHLDVDGECIPGLGISEGVTLIVGGGYHGKSTVLSAIQRGHLEHIPGDGREGVVSVLHAVKVRAEDGRSVASVDISPFLGDLPGGRSTRPFSSKDASGSTSQAAAIIESVEAGATLLLLDEDTSATNLMVRDERMRELIPREQEPITPFVERIRQMYETAGISSLLVIGGVGDYLAVADTVIGMVDFRALDLTGKAHSLNVTVPSPPGPLIFAPGRKVVPSSYIPGKISARDGRRVRYNREDIDLVGVEQILSADHAWSVGQGMAVMQSLGVGEESLDTLLDVIEKRLDEYGVDCLSPRSSPVGDLIRPRRHEIAAALNRHRGLRVEISDKS